jgi:ABC-type Fe3+-siderophore transport system permease subunit
MSPIREFFRTPLLRRIIWGVTAGASFGAALLLLNWEARALKIKLPPLDSAFAAVAA